jgi:predicted DNA-binding transcriptional regulator YafY
MLRESGHASEPSAVHRVAAAGARADDGAGLAAELEVSARTVYRDVESLSGAGVPVYGESGHDGGYALVDRYRTRLTGLHETEADALRLAGLPQAAAELGLGSVLAIAQLKLDAALPPALRDRSDGRTLRRDRAQGGGRHGLRPRTFAQVGTGRHRQPQVVAGSRAPVDGHRMYA